MTPAVHEDEQRAADTASGGVQASEPTPWSVRLSWLSPRRLSAIYLWIAFMVLFGVLVPDTFLTETTFRIVFSEGVVTCVVALAFLIPLTAGIYDISVAAVMSLALAISVYLQVHTDLPPAVGALIAVCACALIGCVSGFVIVRLHVNHIIATLAMSQVLLGIVLLISGNRQVIGGFSDSWRTLGNGEVLGVPNVVLYLLGLSLVLWYVLEFTSIGRYLFATGGNSEAARLSGVKTDKLKWGTLVASATIAGVAGILYSMRSGVFSSTIGPGYLFPALTAVFLGASQLSGRPNVWGTLIAYFALAFGIQGLVLSASDAAVWSQPLFQGIALIVAVALAARPTVRAVRNRRAGGGGRDHAAGAQ